ncbi:amidohydrolase family protein [Dactylosporangium sp. AC04546]|uniref:amidohydrolase family protein n=1 Tax=Dactylosporangium sp. AC04546 TaxID=2862460 RepID=UPI002E7C4620|nr:amidohydrolase family protein [Dactylosporangium sp. AC04546]WVK79325.1 amidohydrolase family protein [Dactylosporangium sp. AC04546]
MSTDWLRNATLADGRRCDVGLADGSIAAVTAAETGGPGGVDLDGYVLLPSFVEPHAHLDKALTASRVENPAGDLLGAIRAMHAAAEGFTKADIARRADRALRIMLAHGTTAVRSHVDVGSSVGMRALEALAEVRAAWAGTVDVQLVALVGNPLAGQAGANLRDALRNGADIAGGCPHLDPEPDRAVGICLDAAADAGRPVDLHTDETLDPGRLTLATLADLVLRTGFPHGVTASHCVSLAVQPAAVQQRVCELVAEAGVAVVALPQTNLYLQGRDHPVGPPRGLTAVRPLQAAGALVAAGGDNLRDPFHPVGRGDPLEVAALMVTAGHLSPAAAVASVTAAPRAALGLPGVAVEPGAPADLVALRGEDLVAALAAADQDRLVWRAGRLVARTTVARTLHAPAPPEAP